MSKQKRLIPEWKRYEDAIASRLSRLVNLPGAEVLVDQKLPGLISGVERQIDVLLTGEIEGSSLMWIVDCKHYSKNIDIKDVETFLGMLKDVGAQKGILVTTTGYSDGAVRRARHDNSEIDLWIVNFEELAVYQGLCGLLFWRPGAVFISAPSGWVIDNRRNRGPDAVPGYPIGQAFLYPMGTTLKKAWQDDDCFMYCNITVDRSLDELIEIQRSTHEGVEQRFLPVKHSERYDIRARTIEAPDFNTVEDTMFIGFENFVFWTVLLSPLDKPAFTAWGRKGLNHIMETALPLLAEGNYLEEQGMTFTPLD